MSEFATWTDQTNIFPQNVEQVIEAFVTTDTLK